MARVIVFISGAKNVGKTHLCVNVAHHMGRLGYGTCLFNADADAAAVYNLLDIHPRRALKDLIENRVRMENVVIKTVHGIDFFPGCPGIEQLGTLDRSARNRMHRAFMDFNRYDFFIVDTFPGLSRNVVALCKSSPEVVLVMNSNARSLTHAYLLLKALTVNKYDGSLMLLINMSRDLKEARKSYHRFKEAASRYLPTTMIPLGTVFHDPRIQNAEKARHPFLSLFPDSDASKCIVNIAQHLCDKKADDLAVSAFWTQFMENLKHPFQIVGQPPAAVRPRSPQGSGENAKPASPASGPLAVSDPENGFGEKTRDALAHIERRLSALTQDVSDIKETLRTLSERRNTMTEPAQTTDRIAAPKAEKLVLDFEAFLEQRNKAESSA